MALAAASGSARWCLKNHSPTSFSAFTNNIHHIQDSGIQPVRMLNSWSASLGLMQTHIIVSAAYLCAHLSKRSSLGPSIYGQLEFPQACTINNFLRWSTPWEGWCRAQHTGPQSVWCTLVHPHCWTGCTGELDVCNTHIQKHVNSQHTISLHANYYSCRCHNENAIC